MNVTSKAPVDNATTDALTALDLGQTDMLEETHQQAQQSQPQQAAGDSMLPVTPGCQSHQAASHTRLPVTPG